MRITFVLETLGMSGGYRIIAHYAEGLRQRGHEVSLVSSAPRAWLSEPRWKSVVKALIGKSSKWQTEATSNRFSAAWLGIKEGKPPWRPGTSHFDQFPKLRVVPMAFAHVIRDQDVPDADVVVATWWETANWVADLAPSKGAKVNFIQQYDVNFDQPAADVDPTWRLPFHKIVCARWLADLAASRFGDPAASVCSNGVNLDLFNAPPRGKQPRPTVGLMYSPHAPKSWATALAVLTETARRIPNLRILTFGELKPTTFLPLPPGAEFEQLPSQERIRDIYSECDVWLCTSSSEGFHLPPHEAMACRCPVVSTRVGGPMDIVEDDINGYLAEPFDAVTLANRLIAVLNFTEDRWRAMSDEAYGEARKHTWEAATDRFEAALQLAIDRTARGELGSPAGESAAAPPARPESSRNLVPA